MHDKNTNLFRGMRYWVQRDQMYEELQGTRGLYTAEHAKLDTKYHREQPFPRSMQRIVSEDGRNKYRRLVLD